MKIAVELAVLGITVFLLLMGEGLAAMLWLAGHAIGFHYGRSSK